MVYFPYKSPLRPTSMVFLWNEHKEFLCERNSESLYVVLTITCECLSQPQRTDPFLRLFVTQFHIDS